MYYYESFESAYGRCYITSSGVSVTIVASKEGGNTLLSFSHGEQGYMTFVGFDAPLLLKDLNGLDDWDTSILEEIQYILMDFQKSYEGYLLIN